MPIAGLVSTGAEQGSTRVVSGDRPTRTPNRRDFLKISAAATAAGALDAFHRAPDVKADEPTRFSFGEKNDHEIPLTETVDNFKSSSWEKAGNQDIGSLVETAHGLGYIRSSDLEAFNKLAIEKSDFQSLRRFFSGLEQLSHSPVFSDEEKLSQGQVHDIVARTSDFAAALKPMMQRFPMNFRTRDGRQQQIPGLTKDEVLETVGNISVFRGLLGKPSDREYKLDFPRYDDYVAKFAYNSVKSRLGISDIEMNRLFAMK